MKITGYTIIFTILGILLFYGLIELEIFLYNTTSLRKDNKTFIGVNVLMLLILLILIPNRFYKKLDQLLKKRIL